jgi:Protein of unknown function (DUF2934)
MSDGKKVPAQEEIELRAYEIYLERGGKEGNALEDWLAAEKELTELEKRELSDPLVKRATAS